MKKYTEVEKANVQNFLFLKGHACPIIDGDKVHYLDRTGGHHRVVRTLQIDSILEEIRVLKRVPLEHYSEKAQYAAGAPRFGIGYYQVFEYRNKLLYVEDLKIEFRSLYQ